MPKKSNVIALIGMSNIGKSHWAKRLAKIGYTKYSIDDLIANKFVDRQMQNTSDLAKWLGQPWSVGYSLREKSYLEMENQSVLEVLNIVDKTSEDKKIIIDTTGSMFYTPQSTIDRLVNIAQIVYLKAPAHLQKQMLQKYLEQPKPVIWGGKFNQRSLETKGQALERSYKRLLEERTKTYEKYAEITIGYEERFESGYNIKDFLRNIYPN